MNAPRTMSVLGVHPSDHAPLLNIPSLQIPSLQIPSLQVPSHLPEKAKSVCCVTWQRETLEGVAGGMITTPLTFDWELPKISSGIIAEQISDAVCTCT